MHPATDRGTPELAAKRSHDQTAEVIDVLYKNGAITENEHWCALHFRWLYTLRFGSPTIHAVDFDGQRHYTPPGHEEDPDWKAERNAEYRIIADVLHQRGLLVAMLRIAVFNDTSILQTRKAGTVKQLFIEAVGFLCTQWRR